MKIKTKFASYLTLPLQFKCVVSVLSSAGARQLLFSKSGCISSLQLLQSRILFQETDVEISHFVKKYLQLLCGWQDCHPETKANIPNTKCKQVKVLLAYKLLITQMPVTIHRKQYHTTRYFEYQGESEQFSIERCFYPKV